MRSLFPVLRLALDDHQPSLRAKFGGVPWGLPAHCWPVCQECGEPMSCLAQIPVRGHLDQLGPLAGRSDLSDRVLHVFTCERLTICSFWEPEAGANAAFFLGVKDLQDPGPTAVSPAAPVLPEVWIEGWLPHDDAVPEEAVASFTDDTRFHCLPEEWRSPHGFDASSRTKLGGVPYWTGNGPSGPPQTPFRFIMQIDRYLTAPEAADGYVDLANFCSDGTGFIFVDAERADLPTLFVINR